MTHEAETSEDREIIEVFEKLKPEYKKIKDIYSGQDETGPKWRAFSDMVERDAAEKLTAESTGKDKARYEARQWFYEDTIVRESESPVYLGYRSLAYNQKQDVLDALKNAYDQTPNDEWSLYRAQNMLPKMMSGIKRKLRADPFTEPPSTSPTSQGSSRAAERPVIIPFTKPTGK